MGCGSSSAAAASEAPKPKTSPKPKASPRSPAGPPASDEGPGAAPPLDTPPPADPDLSPPPRSDVAKQLKGLEAAGVENVDKTLKRITKVFQEADTDRSGTLDIMELATHFRLPLSNPFLPQLELLFADADDDTCQISMEKFVTTIGTIAAAGDPGMEFAWRTLGDLKGEGVLEREELVYTLSVLGVGGYGRDRTRAGRGGIKRFNRGSLIKKFERLHKIAGLETVIHRTQKSKELWVSREEFRDMMKRYARLLAPCLEMWHALEEYGPACKTALDQITKAGRHDIVERNKSRGRRKTIEEQEREAEIEEMVEQFDAEGMLRDIKRDGMLQDINNAAAMKELQDAVVHAERALSSGAAQPPMFGPGLGSLAPGLQPPGLSPCGGKGSKGPRARRASTGASASSVQQLDEQLAAVKAQFDQLQLHRNQVFQELQRHPGAEPSGGGSAPQDLTAEQLHQLLAEEVAREEGQDAGGAAGSAPLPQQQLPPPQAPPDPSAAAGASPGNSRRKYSMDSGSSPQGRAKSGKMGGLAAAARLATTVPGSSSSARRQRRHSGSDEPGNRPGARGRGSTHV